jgi:hypothetical protein
LIRARGDSEGLRPLLALLLGAMIASASGGVAAQDEPSTSTRGDPVASFAYVEPVRRDGAVAYVVRVYGAPPSGVVKVRVRELPEGGGKGAVLFGSLWGRRTPVSSEALAGTVPGAAPDGRPWPLLFAEPPPPGASDRRFRVDLAVNGAITTQHVRVVAADRRWQTSSKLISLVGRPESELAPLPFREAHEQYTLVERFLTGRPAIVVVTGLLLLVLALGVHWAPPEGEVERPSPEQRGTEGRGLLMMLIAVAVASGAMLVRHFVGR